MGKTAEDNGYLPDSAYVVNASGNQQTISKDIKQLDGVTGNYKSGIYEYRWAEISEDIQRRYRYLTIRFRFLCISDNLYNRYGSGKSLQRTAQKNL